MNKRSVRVGAVLFLIGAGIGLLFRQAVRATPADTTPSSPWPKSVFYTERWAAVEGFMNTPKGYERINDFEHNTGVSGEIDDSGEPYVKTSPDLFVTRWRVQGHIHFK